MTTNFLFVFPKPTPTPILTPVPMVAEKVDYEEENNVEKMVEKLIYHKVGCCA